VTVSLPSLCQLHNHASLYKHVKKPRRGVEKPSSNSVTDSKGERSQEQSLLSLCLQIGNAVPLPSTSVQCGEGGGKLSFSFLGRCSGSVWPLLLEEGKTEDRFTCTRTTGIQFAIKGARLDQGPWQDRDLAPFQLDQLFTDLAFPLLSPAMAPKSHNPI
jgi:hypothetical protein